MRWGGAPPGPRLSAPDTGTQTGPRARGAGKLGGAAGAHLRVRGLSGPRAPARPPAARPFRARGARVAGGADSLRCCSVSPCVRLAPGVDHSPPRSPSSLSGGRLGPRRRAEAGSGRRSSGGGRALRGARAEGCALLCPRGRELGPELAAAVAAAAPSAGPAQAGGSRAPRSAPRLLPAPAPPRQPAPGAPPGRDGTGPRTCLRDPFARSFSGQTPGRAWGVPLPGHPAHLPPTSPELCRVLREHLRTHWAAAPGAASAPAGSPQLTSNPRTRFILLWVPPRRRGPVISGSQTRAIPLVLDPWTAPGRAILRVRTAPAAGLTRNAFQKENARPHHFWDRVLAELLR